MQLIPLLDANDALHECDLDGTPFYLNTSWNEAGQLWALSVRDLDRQTLVSGIRIVPLHPLLRQVRRPELPPGELGVACSPGTTLTRDSFATGAASLWYLDEDDMAELAAYVPPPVALGFRAPVAVPARFYEAAPAPITPDPGPDPVVDFLLAEDGTTITDDNGEAIF